MPERGKKSFDEALAGTKRMSEKYVERSPFQFFPESEVVEEVQKGLAQLEVNHGYRYCP